MQKFYHFSISCLILLYTTNAKRTNADNFVSNENMKDLQDYFISRSNTGENSDYLADLQEKKKTVPNAIDINNLSWKTVKNFIHDEMNNIMVKTSEKRSLAHTNLVEELLHKKTAKYDDIDKNIGDMDLTDNPDILVALFINILKNKYPEKLIEMKDILNNMTLNDEVKHNEKSLINKIIEAKEPQQSAEEYIINPTVKINHIMNNESAETSYKDVQDIAWSTIHLSSINPTTIRLNTYSNAPTVPPDTPINNERLKITEKKLEPEEDDDDDDDLDYDDDEFKNFLDESDDNSLEIKDNGSRNLNHNFMPSDIGNENLPVTSLRKKNLKQSMQLFISSMNPFIDKNATLLPRYAAGMTDLYYAMKKFPSTTNTGEMEIERTENAATQACSTAKTVQATGVTDLALAADADTTSMITTTTIATITTATTSQPITTTEMPITTTSKTPAEIPTTVGTTTDTTTIKTTSSITEKKLDEDEEYNSNKTSIIRNQLQTSQTLRPKFKQLKQPRAKWRLQFQTSKSNNEDVEAANTTITNDNDNNNVDNKNLQINNDGISKSTKLLEQSLTTIEIINFQEMSSSYKPIAPVRNKLAFQINPLQTPKYIDNNIPQSNNYTSLNATEKTMKYHHKHNHNIWKGKSKYRNYKKKLHSAKLYRNKKKYRFYEDLISK